MYMNAIRSMQQVQNKPQTLLCKRVITSSRVERALIKESIVRSKSASARPRWLNVPVSASQAADGLLLCTRV